MLACYDDEELLYSLICFVLFSHTIPILIFLANCSDVNIMPAEDILNMGWNFTLHELPLFVTGL